MTDLWIDIILATLVTIATVIADWIANRFIYSTRRIANITRLMNQAITEKEKLSEINGELKKYYDSQASSLTWGSDLAALAFSLDLSILGIWITSPTFFPFFYRWNTPNSSRELPVWLILLFTHFILLLLSIALKHMHSETIDSEPNPNLVVFFRKKWFRRYRFMLITNVVGFLSLVSSFVVITNSI